MSWPHRTISALRRLFHWQRAENDVDEEVRAYFEIAAAREMENGVSREEALRRGRIRFDGPEQVKERVRQSWTGANIHAVVQDLFYACRTLRKKPGYAIVAIGTLALGIGANTVIFSIVSGVLLRPLPFAHPDHLVQLEESSPRKGTGPVSYTDLEDWRQQVSSFASMTAYGNVSKDLQSIAEPERIPAVRAERNLFRTLGVEAVLGRNFREDDPRNVVVLSADLWKRKCAADPSCVGTQIVLDGEPYTVIGVMPDSFQFPYRTPRPQLWIPWEIPSQYAHDRNYHVDFVVGRVKDGIRLDGAKAELSLIAKRLEASYPATNQDRSALMTPLSDVVSGRVRPALLMLLGAVGMVLLIACANVMNLCLGRMASRRHEIAVRCALGAGRLRLMQQLLTESVLLSSIGGAIGFLLAISSSRILLHLAAAQIPRASEIGLDWRVFCFLVVVSVSVGVLFGLAPAISISQVEVQTGLMDAQGGRSLGYGSSKWAGRRLRDSLVVAEMALAFILLTGAGLLSMAFLHLQRIPIGLVTDKVLTLHMSIVLRDYTVPGSYDRYLRQIEDETARVPGVRAVGFIQYLPLQNWGWTGYFTIPGRAAEDSRAELRYVSTGYFRAFGIPLLHGRLFNSSDTHESQQVILINDALSRSYFPNENPVGKRTNRGTIVGVVGDVRQSGLDSSVTPEIYYPFAQNAAATSDAGVSMIVSTLGPPLAVVEDIRSAIHQVNPRQALFEIKMMDQIVAESIADINLYRWLIGLFAALALTLAAAGIYGVISYAVASRTQEFGLRLALGAGTGRLFRQVIGQGLILAAGGLALGIAGSIALTHAFKSFAPSVTSLDPMLLASVSFLLAAIAILACFVPARRAAQVDPIVALRYE